jgi:predicted enzyme related to lactoylglutathione lyase
LKKVEEAGGEVVAQGGDPGHRLVRLREDTEGNVIGLWENA